MYHILGIPQLEGSREEIKYLDFEFEFNFSRDLCCFFPVFKYVATLQKLSLYLFLLLRPVLRIHSEAPGISWHGCFQLIVYCSAKLSSGTPSCLLELHFVHFFSGFIFRVRWKLPTSVNFWQLVILFKAFPYFWKRCHFADCKLQIHNTRIPVLEKCISPCRKINLF